MDKKPIVVASYVRNKQEESKQPQSDKSIFVFMGLSAAYVFALLVKNAPQVAAWIIVIMVALYYAKQIGELVRLLIREIEAYRNRPRLRINKYRR